MGDTGGMPGPAPCSGIKGGGSLLDCGAARLGKPEFTC